MSTRKVSVIKHGKTPAELRSLKMQQALSDMQEVTGKDS